MSTTVFRIEKSREFVVMSNKFLRNKDMSLKAKGLLALCLSLPEDWNYSLNGLVAICKESHTSIRSTLKELEEHGHLVRNRLQGERGQFHYEYIIYESPHSGFLNAENPYTDNLNTEHQYAENNIQQSIDLESIKEQSIKDKVYIDKGVNPSLIPLYKEYLEIRKSINAPLTDRGLKMLITRCNKLSNGNVTVQKLMLENAIMNGWKNVYAPKQQEIDAVLTANTNELKSFYGI